MNGVDFNFEGKYLAVEISNSEIIVNYQLEMITHAEIDSLLPVKRQMKNNRIYLYYEPVGKMPLDRLVMHSKIPDTAFLAFVRGTLSAANELGEYQLSPEGLVLEKEYIFVHPAEYTPSFVYLPIGGSEDNISGVINFLKNMLVSDMVDIKNSGLMQKIITVLNSGKTASDMLRELSSIKGTAAAAEFPRQPVQPTIQQVSQPVQQHSQQSMPKADHVQPQLETQPQTEKRFGKAVQLPKSFAPKQKPTSIAVPNMPSENIHGQNHAPIPDVPRNDTSVSTGKAKKTKADKVKTVPQGAPDMNKIRPVLIGASALIIIIFAALISSGTFNDEAGNLDYTSLIALPIFLVAIDYFLYSKLKEKYVVADGTPAAQKHPKNEKKRNSGIAKRGEKEVFVPVTEIKEGSASQMAYISPVQSTYNSAPQSVPQTSVQPQPYVQPLRQAAPAFADYGKTEVLTDDELSNPYLQNRKGERVDLKSSITRFGKLADQVDVVIVNPKVSRIHADIIMRDGKLYVMDLNSANGTYINGNPERITGNIEYELQNNDRVVFANEEYTVHC